VPFDRDDRDAGTIPIGFEWSPASGRAAGTIVAMEGGPGYPNTGSRDDHLELFAPLRRSRNLLLVDNRGTGTSAVVRCTPLQRWRIADGNPEYLRRVAACGHQLDHTRPLPAAASSTAATCTAPPTPRATWPTCWRPCGPGGSTCTATPTGAGSRRRSPPATRGCCAR
jgi:hypothetical protein